MSAIELPGDSGLQVVQNPIVSLIDIDLYEGCVQKELSCRLREIQVAGAKVIVLLALSDQGKPDCDIKLAKDINKLTIPAFDYHSKQ